MDLKKKAAEMMFELALLVVVLVGLAAAGVGAYMYPGSPQTPGGEETTAAEPIPSES